jgi:hypothetical protein
MTTQWNPFTVLGLPPDPGKLTDDDVRSAWRRIASETHPDREDGGDNQRFTDAANAYTMLRTPWGRSEAWADLREGMIPGRRPGVPQPPWPPLPRPWGRWRRWWSGAARLPARIRHGSPARLALRTVAAAGVGTGVWLIAPGTPAAIALQVGIGTWLLRTGRSDLAPPPGR